MSIPYLIAAMISPILGKLVDFYGFRAVIVAVSPSLLFVVHTLLALTRASAFYVLVLQGIAYASYAAVVWPSIPLIVEEKFTGEKKYFTLKPYNKSYLSLHYPSISVFVLVCIIFVCVL